MAHNWFWSWLQNNWNTHKEMEINIKKSSIELVVATHLSPPCENLYGYFFSTIIPIDHEGINALWSMEVFGL